MRFSSPKARRLHLIALHQFPPEYFFSVVNWGIADILKKGGGMLRHEWKQRASDAEDSSGSGSGWSAESSRSPEHEAPPNLALTERTDDDATPTRASNTSKAIDVDGLTAAFASANMAMIPRSVRKAASKPKSVSTPLCERIILRTSDITRTHARCL